MNVCVFCASTRQLLPVHAEAGRRLGAWIGERGHALVWGGCNVGLMDVVGRAARASGARTVAVIPAFLVERGLAFADADERIVTADMQSRKATLRGLADAFVALPGGIGTWEEVFEVLALRKLEQLDKPIVIANIDRYYDPLLEQIRRSLAAGMSPPEIEDLFDIARSADEVGALLGR